MPIPLRSGVKREVRGCIGDSLHGDDKRSRARPRPACGRRSVLTNADGADGTQMFADDSELRPTPLTKQTPLLRFFVKAHHSSSWPELYWWAVTKKRPCDRGLGSDGRRAEESSANICVPSASSALVSMDLHRETQRRRSMEAPAAFINQNLRYSATTVTGISATTSECSRRGTEWKPTVLIGWSRSIRRLSIW